MAAHIAGSHAADSACPTRDRLADWLLGRLSEPGRDTLEAHVSRCEECQHRLETLDGFSDELLDALQETAAGPEVNEQEVQNLVAQVKSILAEDELEAKNQPPPGHSLESAPPGEKPAGQLGQYLLLERLGQGGMGTVYKALHTKLKRLAAVKVIADRRLRDEEAVARFHREMEAVGRLDHPNIVRAHDAGEAEGRHFLVMEFIEGTNLAKLVRGRGPLSVAGACEIIRQAALGLQHAHEHGLVHRDVKPSNLMLVRDGSVKVLDLGLARLQAELDEQQDEGSPEEPGEAAADVTATGHVLGSPQYMAPEQRLDSRQTDARTDIYSLGCTLYFLLSGNPPAAATPTPLGQLRPGLDEDFTGLVERMLAHEPGDRLASMAAVVQSLIFSGSLATHVPHPHNEVSC